MTNTLSPQLESSIREAAEQHYRETMQFTKEAVSQLLPKSYKSGVVDGIENTCYSSFMAGARAVLKLQKQEGQ